MVKDDSMARYFEPTREAFEEPNAHMNVMHDREVYRVI